MHSVGAQKAKYRYTRLAFKDVQRFEITIPAGATSGTTTLPRPFNTGKTLPVWNGYHCADTALNPATDFPDVALTDSRTLTATTNTANATFDRVVRVTLFEFNDFAIRGNIQFGTVNFSANTTADATILPVSSLAAIQYLGQTTNRTAYNLIRDSVELSFTSSTNVRGTRGNFTAADTIAVRFAVVDFNPGVLASLQTALVNIPSGSTSGTATINSVVPANCMTLYGGFRQTVLGTDNKTFWPRGELTDATTLTAYQNTASAAGQSEENLRMTVLEFNPLYLYRRQGGNAVIASGAATQDDTISESLSAKTGLSYLWQTTNTNSNSNAPFSSVKLNSSTQARAERGSNPATTVTTAWEAVHVK